MRLVLVALLILALVLIFVTGVFIVFGILIVALAGLLVAAERLCSQFENAEGSHESAFTRRSVDEIPPRPNFVLTEFDAQMAVTNATQPRATDLYHRTVTKTGLVTAIADLSAL